VWVGAEQDTSESESVNCEVSLAVPGVEEIAVGSGEEKRCDGLGVLQDEKWRRRGPRCRSHFFSA